MLGFLLLELPPAAGRYRTFADRTYWCTAGAGGPPAPGAGPAPDAHTHAQILLPHAIHLPVNHRRDEPPE